MRARPLPILLASIAIVAISSFALPHVEGYGTVLFQLIAFGAYALVETITSRAFIQSHIQTVWLTAGALNVLLFAVPALIIYFVLKNKRPTLTAYVCAGWACLYLGSLLFLFPAVDGP